MIGTADWLVKYCCRVMLFLDKPPVMLTNIIISDYSVSLLISYSLRQIYLVLGFMDSLYFHYKYQTLYSLSANLTLYKRYVSFDFMSVLNLTLKR